MLIIITISEPSQLLTIVPIKLACFPKFIIQQDNNIYFSFSPIFVFYLRKSFRTSKTQNENSARLKV